MNPIRMVATRGCTVGDSHVWEEVKTRYGAGEGIRTPDLLITSEPLCLAELLRPTAQA